MMGLKIVVRTAFLIWLRCDSQVSVHRLVCIHLIPGLRRQRQVNLCELEDSLIYIVVSCGTAKAMERNPVSKQKGTKERK